MKLLKLLALAHLLMFGHLVTAQYKISPPPEELSLDDHYKKYVAVNGIHIISSEKVPDEAVYAACKTIDFMTRELPEAVLKAMVDSGTKVGIMGRYEGTTDIPEHAHLEKDTTLNWDLRARGLGGTIENPLTTCAEENLLCYQIDKYHAEDILIHEFAHSIHLIGIIQVDTTFNETLQKLLDTALQKGKYQNVYAATNISEYWAEAVQNWFNVNAEMPEPDGKHNWVNTRSDMKKYDPPLYELVSRFFSDFNENPSCHTSRNEYKK